MACFGWGVLMPLPWRRCTTLPSLLIAAIELH
jgi:hypothetical protein